AAGHRAQGLGGQVVQRGVRGPAAGAVAQAPLLRAQVRGGHGVAARFRRHSRPPRKPSSRQTGMPTGAAHVTTRPRATRSTGLSNMLLEAWTLAISHFPCLRTRVALQRVSTLKSLPSVSLKWSSELPNATPVSP